MKKRELTFIIIALVLGAVFGGLLGDIIGAYLPAGAAKTIFTVSKEIGFSPIDRPSRHRVADRQIIAVCR